MKHRLLTRARKVVGFTLIELLVVVAIIGGLIAILAPTTSGSTAKVDTALVVRAASAVADNWVSVTRECKVSSNPADAALGDMGDLLFRGTVANTASHQACLDASGVKPLLEVASYDGTADVYKIIGYPAVISGSAGLITLTLQGVPDDVALPIVKRYRSDLTGMPETADNTSAPYLTFTARVGGVRNITIGKRF